MRAHPPHIHAVAAVLAFASLLAFGASSAFAEQRGHVTTPRVFGSGLLKEPDGVAVNEETGIVYVADSGNNRVAMFNGTTGASLGEINGSGTLVKRGTPGAELEAEGKPAGGGTDPDEEPTGAFSDPTLIAVDNSCEQQKPKLEGSECAKFDPSNGDVYVLDNGHKVVDKYTAAGKYVGQITKQTLGMKEEFDNLAGVAVEADGDVLVSTYVGSAGQGNQEGVFRLSDEAPNKVLPSPGDPTGFTWAGQAGYVNPGLAAAGGRVFVDQSILSEVTVWSMEGTLLAGGRKFGSVPSFEGPIGGLGGEACTGDVYVDTGTTIERLEGGGGLVETLPVPGGAAPEHQGVGYGVAPDCASLSVFAVNVNTGVVDVYGPEPPQAPTIEADSGFASEVTDDGAKLSGTLNPRTEPGEGETTYVFEYGPCPVEGSCAGAAYPQGVGGSVPAEYGPVVVSSSLRGLSANTRYHYRLSAYNKFDEPPAAAVSGEELTFTTQPSFPGGLLDERSWELVTPPDKYGAEIEPVKETGVIQAAANGGAIAYLASAPIEESPAGNSNKTQVLSRRGENGWESCDIALPHARATGASIGAGQEYRAFAPDLQAGVVLPLGVLVPGLVAGEREVSPLLVGLASECGGQPSYRPLLASCPAAGECEPAVQEDADLEPGIELAEENACLGKKPGIPALAFCTAEPLGSNESLSAVVMRSEKPLFAGAPAGALYEYSGGHVYPVSVLANGTVEGGGPLLGSGEHSQRGAVSEDGSRVAWSEALGGKHLYVWDRASGKSVQVDTVQKETGVAGGEGGVDPVFQFATADGSKVFFTDTQRLTANANEKETADLYECDVEVEGEGEESKPKCALRDLTPKTGSGESARVLGEALGGSENGGLVYFVANGELTKTPSPNGEHAVKGDCTTVPHPKAECNLYVWSEASPEPALVAVLSGEDVDDWGGTSTKITELTGRVSGDGEWLAFMSQRSLTGYDTRDAANAGVRDEEVYEYRYGKGVMCVSCNPTGERPHGSEYHNLAEGAAAGESVWPPEVWLSGFVPAWTPVRLGGVTQRQPRYLDASGRMFFDSTDGLLPHDTNGTMDVYEYEPAGVGSCEEGGEGYIPTEKGCLGLVSSGESPEESGFLDASENGNDVFFLTKSKLSKHDTDTSYDIYDASVGGIEPPESKPVECQGDACQSPVTPPESLTPSSATFSGPGNILTPPAPGANTETKTKPKAKTRQQKLAGALKQCRKAGSRARRKTCEQKARAKYGAMAKKTTRRRGK